MFKYAAIAVAVLTLFTSFMVGSALLGSAAPKFDVAAASDIFARYPYWQSNSMNSTEVVVDLQFVREADPMYQVPASISQDALATWQEGGKQQMVLEFGLDRLGSGITINNE